MAKVKQTATARESEKPEHIARSEAFRDTFKSCPNCKSQLLDAIVELVASRPMGTLICPKCGPTFAEVRETVA